MAAFSYQQQQHHLLLDSANYNLPNIPIEMSLGNTSPCHPFYYPVDAIGHARAQESSSSLDSRALDHSSMLVDTSYGGHEGEGDGASKPHGTNMEIKKRKKREGTCLSSTQSKETKESRNRKKRASGTLKGTVEEKASHEEADPQGYIHVRARRGQATDSHSLAERVRREKISERMKMLQDLVPGCDKVTGKALMLDEIINYVQSLQNQVEFLSMKLASLSPMLYNFGVDLDCCMVSSDQKLDGLSQPLNSTGNQLACSNHNCSQLIPSAFEDTKNSYKMMMEASSASFFLLSQENGSSREGLLGQVLPNINMCSFQ